MALYDKLSSIISDSGAFDLRRLRDLRLVTPNSGLVIREVDDLDYDGLYSMLQNPRVRMGVGNLSVEINELYVRRMIESARLHAARVPRKEYSLVVEHPEGLVGNVTLKLGLIYGDLEQAKLGFICDEPFWDKGSIVEALGGLFDYAFDSLGLERIYGESNPNNDKSLDVLSRLGFLFNGTMRGAYRDLNGVRSDLLSFDLLKSDWVGRKAL